ncbi:ABC transporter permease [Noviherbaspirillum sp. UKPF54]|uniref:ABC transporter permease n=1 Tax=Noviherbaspirillum sp. UKPF54 TaxID=2601898 RepID=UPI0011B160A6|nr:ABC transporter permease [Noviherbaspirillum sp. UKPF54]QDZ30604.1 ABC transporter permease [Noviherbaspirillum sp. UKPF54]
MLSSVWRNRQLILQMTKREVVGRYRGSVMGLAWSFFNPLLMLVIYTFVFSVVFKARWGGNESVDKGSFAILLFVGMIVHGLFAECANRAPGLVVSNVSFVKKVVFPLEILPWIAMGSALFHTFVSLVVLLLVQLFLNHVLPWTVIFFPIIAMPLVLAGMGVAWFLASVGVYLRDVAQTVSIFTTVLMFLSPVFYPISALPEKYHIWLRLNPLSSIIEEGRKSLVFGLPPDWINWSLTTLASVMMAWLGFWWFQKTRRGFADVL